jgi:tRNA threonylcarbamoyladenosine biosynthesis protein TsaE
MNSFSVVSTGPEHTAQIASLVAETLRPGDVVLLSGDLASGKTTFVKGVAAALGSSDTVTSPTFMLAQFYQTAAAPILHMDAYRLSDVAEFRDLALEDYAEDSITFVEWGEKVGDEFPCHATILFSADHEDPDHRTLRFASDCDRWTAVLPLLRTGVALETA